LQHTATLVTILKSSVPENDKQRHLASELHQGLYQCLVDKKEKLSTENTHLPLETEGSIIVIVHLLLISAPG
jgi:signal transduction histidine kinase